MSGLLTPTSFSTGIDVNLATPDIYNIQSSQEVINITPDIENVFINATKSISFIPDANALENINIIKGKDTNGLLVDAEALKDGILSSASGALGAFRTLPSELQNKLLNVNGYNNIKLSLNGIESFINNANLSTINGLGELIRTVTGCPFPLGAFDRNGNILLGTNILRQVYLFDMFGAYGAFIACLEDRFVGSGITRRLIPTLVNTSSIPLLKDISNGPFVNEIKTYSPNFVKDFVSNFKLKPNTPVKEYGNILNDTFSSFDKIDSEWSKYKSYTDFSSLNNRSKDFDKVLDVGRGLVNVNIPNTNLNTINTSTLDKKSLLIGVNQMAKNANFNVSVSEKIKNDFPLLA